MEVQIISKKLIKPSVPTPNHLENMKISFIDHSFFPATVPTIFCYPSNHHPPKSVERQNQLAKSLSETLTLFYPLAGRYMKENFSVKCNDEGVEYIEALVDGQLSRILQGEFEAKDLNRFIPAEVEESSASPLVAIQINVFNCGGLAIGLWFSHRIMDCFTFSRFMHGWANTCNVGINDRDHVIIPKFEAGILFPPREISWGSELPSIAKPEVVTKRFVFDAETISKLKAVASGTATSSGLNDCPPSTVEVMTALIWRAQINARKARYGQLRASLMSMPMNLRGRTFEKIPENCCGNLFAWVNARFLADDSKMGLSDFVGLVGGAIRESVAEFAKPMEGEDEFFSKVMRRYMELVEELRKEDGDLRLFASWRNFGLYEVDFGWGKPIWVSATQRPFNGIILVDRKGGDGIEIWITMDVEDMAHFQQDPYIRNFSS